MKSWVLPEIEAYAEVHSWSESEICRRLREETTRTMAYPQMVVGPLEGAFLKLMTRLVKAERILEIGTFTGYSALCFAEALPPNGTVLTCEVDPQATALAGRYFRESPHGNKITVKLGPALETMQALAGPFDLIFIDADKRNYVNYYQRSLDLIREGGVIVIDNVLWNGEVLRHPPPDESTAVIQELNRLIRSDRRVSAVLLPLRDGVFVVTPGGVFDEA